MKTPLGIGVSLLTFFVASAWHLSNPAELAAPQTNDSIVEHNDNAERNTSKIWTQKALLFRGDTLELHFALPHAAYLGVVDPKGHFFYLVFPGEPSVGSLTPLVDSKDFSALKTLIINTYSLKADPYIYNVTTNQPVFTISGAYTFILGDDLHVDDPALLDNVVVHYKHMRRFRHVSIPTNKTTPGFASAVIGE